MKTGTIISALEQLIPDRMKQAGVPGLAIALIDHGDIVWEAGFGVQGSASQTRVTRNTIFEAASLSKPVFAYGVLQLCQQGILTLDTPLVHHYPLPYTEDGFKPDDPFLKLVTARHVLSHSGGFGNWGEKQAGKINSRPGEKFFYGGEGYVYLQRVVEYVMHSSLAEYMASSVFEPLNMASSSYTWKPSFEQRLATGQGNRDAGVGSRWQEALAPYTLYTTVHDFATFLMAISSSNTGKASFTGDHLLKEMATAQIAISETLGWGLGWGVEQTPRGSYCWHWGDIGDFTSFAIFSRISGAGLVIMTNSDKGPLLFEDITRAALDTAHPCFAFFLKKA